MKKRLLILSIISQFIYADSYHLKPFNTNIQEKTIEDNYCQENNESLEFCIKNKLIYPIVTTDNPKLKESIEKNIKEYITEFKKGSAKESLISELKDIPDLSTSYEDTTIINVYDIMDKIFTISLYNYSFTGGAHGNQHHQFYNYLIENGKEIRLEHILVEGYKKRLKKIAEKAYRDSNNYMPNEDLTNFGWFENNFSLSDNYAITNDGVEFFYDPYEIKPYSMGTTQFTIPYYMLKDIIKRDNLIADREINKIVAKSNTKILKSPYGQITTESRRLTNNSIELKFTMKSLTEHKRGWFSISFPQLKSKESIETISGDGFKNISTYNRGKKLYNFYTKSSVESKYLLVEGDANIWSKDSSKSIEVVVKLPNNIDNLYINLRGSFKTKEGIEVFPDYGDEGSIIEGQQGFPNFRIKI